MTIEEKIKAFPVIVMDRVVGWWADRNSMNKGKVAEKKDLIRYKFDLTKKK